jgi:hypothetical protein
MHFVGNIKDVIICNIQNIKGIVKKTVYFVIAYVFLLFRCNAQ